MIINTNMTGTGGTPPANSTDQPGSKSKPVSPSDISSGAPTLDSQVSRTFAGAGSDFEDSDAAGKSAQLARTNILNQPLTAMLAQANLSPETALSLLQA